MSYKNHKRLKAVKHKSTNHTSTPVSTHPPIHAIHPRLDEPEPLAESAIPHAAVMTALHGALDAVQELIDRRREAKFSIARLLGVSRELRELLKVMSVYGA